MHDKNIHFSRVCVGVLFSDHFPQISTYEMHRLGRKALAAEIVRSKMDTRALILDLTGFKIVQPFC